MNKQLEDDFDSLSEEEIQAADDLFESSRTIHAHALYFINTGEFYAEHTQIRDALNLFLERTTEQELSTYLDEITKSVNIWIYSKDYRKSFYDSDIKHPDYRERKLIAAEILDHWTERKLTKELNKLCKDKINQ